MKDSTADATDLRCTCFFDDPRVGPQCVTLAAISTRKGIVLTLEELTLGMYVDVILQIGKTARKNLAAQILECEDDVFSSDQEVDEEIRTYALRWVHSDPEQKTELGRFVRDHLLPEDGEEGEDGAEASSEIDLPDPNESTLIRIPRARESAPPVLAESEPEESTAIQPLAEGLPESETELPPLLPGMGPAEIDPDTPPVLSGARDVAEEVSVHLHREARTVSAAELAARHKTVKVLNTQTIKELIQGAVTEAIGTRAITDEERKEMLAQTEDVFRERFETFEAERYGLEKQTEVLRKQLERAQAAVETQRGLVGETETLPEAAVIALEERLERVLARALRRTPVAEDVAEEMRSLIGSLLEQERERVESERRGAQQDQITLLERKIQRLARNLDTITRERDEARELAAALEASGSGLRNVIHSTIDKDPLKEKKKELLATIFRENKEMREEVAALKS